MAAQLQYFSGVLAATDTVAFTVPAGRTRKVSSITLSQPAGAATATVSIAISGTSLTAANVRLLQLLTTGTPQSYILYPNWVLPAAATLNISCTTGAQTNAVVSGNDEVVAA